MHITDWRHLFEWPPDGRYREGVPCPIQSGMSWPFNVQLLTENTVGMEKHADYRSMKEMNAQFFEGKIVLTFSKNSNPHIIQQFIGHNITGYIAQVHCSRGATSEVALGCCATMVCCGGAR